MAGFVFPLEGQGLGDAAVQFLGPERAVGQTWVREMCLGHLCGERTHAHGCGSWRREEAGRPVVGCWAGA